MVFRKFITTALALMGVFMIGAYTASTLKCGQPVKIHQWVATVSFTILFLSMSNENKK
jgi:hypothetical protein